MALPDKTHPSWQIDVEVGEQMAKDRQEAEKQALGITSYGRERAGPMEGAKRYLEAGPDLKMKMLKDMRQPRDGMKEVRRFIEAVNKVQGRESATGGSVRPPQLRTP